MAQVNILEKQAHDISFAVFRVARLVRHKELRAELESQAIGLVSNIDIERIDSFVRIINLGQSVGEIEKGNWNILSRELGKLYAMVVTQNTGQAHPAESIDLSDTFSSNSSVDNIQPEASTPVKKKNSTDYPQRRRGLIHEFIRQLPDGCRMRDLLVQFPDSSERTLRSDIQKLVDAGLIERAGSKSGPFSYLRAVDSDETVKNAPMSAKEAINEFIMLPEADPRN